MNCPRCGRPLALGETVCRNCGQPVGSTQAPVQMNYGAQQPNYMSPWAYVGYNLLFMLPIVGFILLIVFSVDNDNINRRNYARSFFCVMLLALIISVVALIPLFIFGFDVFDYMF